jgi:hypothetical protein
VTAPISRAEPLSRGAKGGVGLLASGSIAGALTGSAAADTVPDGDLAHARLLVGAELLAAEFPLRIDEASDALDAFAN